MSAEEQGGAKLLGDVCPSWCGGESLHMVWREREDGKGMHQPEDRGVMHYSAPVDSWHPLYGEDGERDDQAIMVTVEGQRHDHVGDWPDMISATNVAPGLVGGIDLQVEDARRLAHALLKACDLADTSPAVRGGCA